MLPDKSAHICSYAVVLMADLLEHRAVQILQTEGLSTYTLEGYLPEFLKLTRRLSGLWAALR